MKMTARFVLAAAVSASAIPLTAHAAPVTPCTKAVPNDLNGDGKADVVVGQPKAVVDGVADAGAVDVRITGGSSFRLTGAATGLGAATSATQYGYSVAVGLLDGDCYADLLIGVPRAGNGRAVYVPGSADGVDTTKAKVLTSGTAEGSDRFGYAVAIGRRTAFVAAPYFDTNGVKNAGQIHVFQLEAQTAEQKAVLQQGTAPVKDSPEAGDHYGEALAYRGDTLAVGLPKENIVSATDAGAAHLTTFAQDDASRAETDVFLNQESAGVPGSAEKGDNFGAAFDDQARAIGVPGEDVKSAVDAGGIITQLQTMTTNSPALRWVSQSTKGIPGKSKTGDRFGSALASGLAFLCPNKTSIAVGIPGKKVDDKASAGMVTVVAETTADCGTTQGRQITQDTSAIAGKVGKANEFGKAFITVPVIGGADGLLAGSPGANLDNKKDTGRVGNAINLPKTNLRSLGGTQTATFYGSVTTQR